ncbi:histone-lysine N-methyltransferase 2D-like [Zingiber officinale]|uniref:PB1 domain-containing protein n=1 Tax=Zingiber officinale TaxID=94328 RepID=A0A8J5K6P6_ZINOF|nr:histone-lysine N-methyltransferase 2D-like [Zingiber officinale]KAG6475169.1 hypothetical protein ZIOFF_064387 [Zingiber officinale]
MESASAGASAPGYPDSVDSSPRSRGGDSWDEPLSSTAAASSRIRVMCSYGGRILPRPTDKSLCYLGGETRMVVIDRHATLAELSAKLSRDLLGGTPFTLKYQLPNEDLDSLISVSTDEDLENMIDELDRITAAPATSGSGSGSRRSARLRLFLFPSKFDSAPSSAIGSLIDESKSESWFVDALNSAIHSMGMEENPRGSTDSASINCLLGLDDDSSVHSRGGSRQLEPERPILPRPDSSGRLGRHGQEVQSVPGSPMLDKASSFGSTSSAPLSNLPPIPVPSIDRATEHQDDHSSRMNQSPVSATKQRAEEVFKDAGHAPPPRQFPSIPLPVVSASSPVISPTENPNREFSDDDRPDQGDFRKPTQLPTPTQNNDFTRGPASRVMNSNPNSEPKIPYDAGYYVSPPVSELPAYERPSMQPEQLQQQQPHIHIHQQHPQFMPANTHYMHQTATGTVLSMPPYYSIASHSMQQAPQVHSLDPQIPVFYMPVHHATPYNLAAVQPNLTDPNTLPSLGKPSAPVQGVPTRPGIPATAYGTAAIGPASAPSALQPQLVHVAGNQSHPYAGAGYHVVQHPHLSQTPATMANYSYEMPAATGHPQLYHSLAASQPALPRQYQTPSSTVVIHEGVDANTSKSP